MAAPAPPRAVRPGTVGGSWDTDKAKRRDAAITAVHAAAANADIRLSPSKVARMVQKFDRVARRSGATFHEFLTREANLPPAAVRQMMAHPEWHRVIAYADPVGEKAVNHVMRERGF